MVKYTDEDIDAFIENTMTADKRKDFRKTLDEDAELREKVALRHLVVEAEIIEAEKDMRSILASPVKTTRTQSKRIIAGLVAVAAVVILIIGFSPVYSPVDLFYDYYETPHIDRSRSGSIDAYDQLKEAVYLLDKGKAGEAIDILNQVRDESYNEETNWILLCAYLAIDDRDNSLLIADKIISGNGFYADVAFDIKNKLNMKRWF